MYEQNAANYLATPAERFLAWHRYATRLERQLDRPLFEEKFGLRQIYIPLRGFWVKRDESKNRQELFDREGIEPGKRMVVDLQTELDAWFENGDSADAIRVLSGGPGSGKSSFGRWYATHRTRLGDHVLFIQLHHFEFVGDLADAIRKYATEDGIVSHNLFDPNEGEMRLLLIFDGLDELASQGKVGLEAAKTFVGQVERLVRRLNRDGELLRIQVIVAGRELVVQANANEFRKEKQILHLMPYVLTEPYEERSPYEWPSNIQENDQRQDWWAKFREATGETYTGMPPEGLDEITSQPLLNYLVALSVRHGKLKFTESTNLNEVYADLLARVYERAWGSGKNVHLRTAQGLNPLTEHEFNRALEEVAIAVWHGNGRSATVKQILEHCDLSGTRNLIERFNEGAEAGITRLLVAFFFREQGHNNDNERSFEFTHKSFGEYLTARRLMRALKTMWDERQRYDDPYSDAGWSVNEALQRWVRWCGPSAIDYDLLTFLIREMRLQKEEEVLNWKRMLCSLISTMLHQGLPMENVGLFIYQEMTRQARNAEEALLVALSATMECLIQEASQFEPSNISWPSHVSALSWLQRLRCSLSGGNSSIANLCLAGIKLTGQYLVGIDLFGADLRRADLIEADLMGADLRTANLSGANLSGAELSEANLIGANLIGANLSDANLSGANLSDANLSGANLSGMDLSGFDLSETHTRRMTLTGIDLSEADLTGANLMGANLTGADLRGADLYGANLSEVYMYGADLIKADMRGANLQGADLTGVYNLDQAKQDTKS